MDESSGNGRNGKKKEFRLDLNLDNEEFGQFAEVPAEGETVPKQPDSPPQPADIAGAADGPQPETEAAQITAQLFEPAAQAAAVPAAKKSKAEKPKGRRGCATVMIYVAAVVVASILIAAMVLSSVNDMLGLYKADKQIDIQIPASATAQQITNILKDSGVIQNPFSFRLYLSFSKASGFKSGDYALNSDMTYSEIVKTLKGDYISPTVVKVTIPEGYTMRQIAALLEKKKVCSASSFLSACENDTFKSTYVAAIPQSSKRFYKLEGYLFPDTYNFYVNSSPQTVVQKMLSNFSDKFTTAMAAKAKKMNMTVDQTLILASVIQTEAGSTGNMGTISSVFHNRLEKGKGSLQFLQSDATILYITRTIEKTLQKTDLAVNSPYNTYKNAGLPPGAICNPGLSAINGALNPDQTDYFFFVSDVNGKYYYSATLAQHEKAVIKARKVGNVSGTDVTGVTGD
ncbi:MAG: endolytic transglycosylase MltG [Clostridia bacterium]|nr:endolytic transglycosylase MltG [Clostridia bacterium]